MGRRSRAGRYVFLASWVGLAAIALSACGGATAPKSSTPGVLTLNIGVGSSATNYGAFWVAQAHNLFSQNQLDVNVVSYNTSGTTANVVASGQVQLQLFTAPLGLEVAAQGKPISIVDELASFNAGSMVVIGAKGVTSAAQIKSLSSCKLVTTAVGTVPYAYAIRFLKAEGITNCSITNEATVAPLMAAVTSGFAQVGVVTYSNALAAISAGKVNMLINPLKVPATLAKEIVPTAYPAFVVFGLRSTVSANRVAVTRFVKALRQANALLLKTGTDQLGSGTAGLSAFAGIPATSLADAWAGTMSQIPTGANAGFISSSAWSAALQGFKDWGLPAYNASSPSIAYKQVIDMSYFNAAG